MKISSARCPAFVSVHSHGPVLGRLLYGAARGSQIPDTEILQAIKDKKLRSWKIHPTDQELCEGLGRGLMGADISGVSDRRYENPDWRVQLVKIDDRFFLGSLETGFQEISDRFSKQRPWATFADFIQPQALLMETPGLVDPLLLQTLPDGTPSLVRGAGLQFGMEESAFSQLIDDTELGFLTSAAFYGRASADSKISGHLGKVNSDFTNWYRNGVVLHEGNQIPEAWKRAILRSQDTQIHVVNADNKHPENNTYLIISQNPRRYFIGNPNCGFHRLVEQEVWDAKKHASYRDRQTVMLMAPGAKWPIFVTFGDAGQVAAIRLPQGPDEHRIRFNSIKNPPLLADLLQRGFLANAIYYDLPTRFPGDGHAYVTRAFSIELKGRAEARMIFVSDMTGEKTERAWLAFNLNPDQPGRVPTEAECSGFANTTELEFVDRGDVFAGQQWAEIQIGAHTLGHIVRHTQSGEISFALRPSELSEKPVFTRIPVESDMLWDFLPEANPGSLRERFLTEALRMENDRRIAETQRREQERLATQPPQGGGGCSGPSCRV